MAGPIALKALAISRLAIYRPGMSFESNTCHPSTNRWVTSTEEYAPTVNLRQLHDQHSATSGRCARPTRGRPHVSADRPTRSKRSPQIGLSRSCRSSVAEMSLRATDHDSDRATCNDGRVEISHGYGASIRQHPDRSGRHSRIRTENELALEVAQPDKPKTGEPFLIDEESLISLIDALRNQIWQIQHDQGRPGDLPH